MAFLGFFAGKLRVIPNQDLDYSSAQTINLIVKQDNNILTLKKIEHINSDGVNFEISYEYFDFVNPVYLILQSAFNNTQFNLDNIVELSELKIDNLYTSKKLLSTGELFKENQLINSGNALYCTGELIYKFNLPIFGLLSRNIKV